MQNFPFKHFWGLSITETILVCSYDAFLCTKHEASNQKTKAWWKENHPDAIPLPIPMK